MINKRGQAAMEFLMTYGWAILAAVIVVGVLWYMIGNPANLAGNEFQMAAPFVGNAMSINTTHVQVEIRNGMAEQVTVQNITLSEGGCNGISAPETVAAGNLSAFSIDCDALPESGGRYNADVALKYTTPGSSLEQTATGSIRGVIP